MMRAARSPAGGVRGEGGRGGSSHDSPKKARAVGAPGLPSHRSRSRLASANHLPFRHRWHLGLCGSAGVQDGPAGLPAPGSSCIAEASPRLPYQNLLELDRRITSGRIDQGHWKSSGDRPKSRSRKLENEWRPDDTESGGGCTRRPGTHEVMMRIFGTST